MSSPLVGGWYYEMQELGFNYRLTDIQCALGISQLKKLDQFIERRNLIAREYHRAFHNNPYFEIPHSLENKRVKLAWHLYPICLKEKAKRNIVFERLRQKGIGVQVHYIPVYWQPYYQRPGYGKGLCPRAEDFYERVISLPIFPAMRTRNIRQVIKTVLNVVENVS